MHFLSLRLQTHNFLLLGKFTALYISYYAEWLGINMAFYMSPTKATPVRNKNLFLNMPGQVQHNKDDISVVQGFIHSAGGRRTSRFQNWLFIVFAEYYRHKLIWEQDVFMILHFQPTRYESVFFLSCLPCILSCPIYSVLYLPRLDASAAIP